MNSVTGVPAQVPDDGQAPVLVSYNGVEGAQRQLRHLHAARLGPPDPLARGPGTGKTTALRALIRSWKAWCPPRRRLAADHR